MTRCCKDSINLKSSVYNQTGQSYIDQLSLHRSMCTHLRRVLLAKSVVDSRNPRYEARGQVAIPQRRTGPASISKLRFYEGCPSEETIDKLAYDTEHHPSEIMKVYCRSKSSSKDRSCSSDRQRVINDSNCSCLRPSTAKDCSSIPKANLKSQKKSDDFHDIRAQYRTKEINHDKQQFCDSKFNSSPCRSTRSRKCKYEATATTQELQLQQRGAGGPLQRCTPSPESRCPAARPRCEISQSEEEEEEEEEEDEEERCRELETFRKLAEQRGEEEALYAKFVYDITQEIVQNGLYTDRELKEVFEKHLEKSSGHLNKRKMMYEICQLKISLHMMDDSEDEDEVEADLIYAEKFSNLRVPKPPTPPKVLNENKVIEKLECFRQLQENGECSVPSSPRKRSVVLVDANPEFLVTERDVLLTLMDNHVDPDQIQRIYRNLFQKSKDMSLCEAVQVGSEVAYAHRLKVDRSSSAISLNNIYAKDKSHGILRKESTDFTNKPLSPQMSSHKLSYFETKQNEALEKCAKWKSNQCDCKKQPCKEHNMEVVEKQRKQRRQSSIKASVLSKEHNKGVVANRRSRTIIVTPLEDKLRKEDYSNKKIIATEKARAEKKIEKSKKQEKPRKSASKEVKSSPETSERSSDIQEMITGEKRDSRIASKEVKSSRETSERSSDIHEMITGEKRDSARSKTDTVEARRSVRSEENEEIEEIEEDIESVIDELPESSPRRSSSAEHLDKSDDEEKELSSVQEENEEAEDQPARAASVASAASSDKSLKYSEDFSSSSESSSKNTGGKSSPTKGKVNDGNQRYSTMKEYFERFATLDDQKIWRISEGSSSSSPSSVSSHTIGDAAAAVAHANYLQPPRISRRLATSTIEAAAAVGKADKKRTSSGMSGFKVMDSWNERLSELSSEFYANSAAKYCEAHCRGTAGHPAGKAPCNESCKFARTNCRGISEPTECLDKLVGKSESSESFGSA